MDPVILGAGIMLAASGFILGRLSAWPAITQREHTIHALMVSLKDRQEELAVLTTRDARGRFTNRRKGEAL